MIILTTENTNNNNFFFYRQGNTRIKVYNPSNERNTVPGTPLVLPRPCGYVPELNDIVMYLRNDGLFWPARVMRRTQDHRGWSFDLMRLDGDRSAATETFAAVEEIVQPFTRKTTKFAMHQATDPTRADHIFTDLEIAIFIADQTIAKEKGQREFQFLQTLIQLMNFLIK